MATRRRTRTAAPRSNSPRRSVSEGAVERALAVEREKAREQAEHWLDVNRQLHESRDYFATLFHEAPVGYAVLNTSGVISEINAAAAVLLGIPAETAAGKPLTVLVNRRHTSGVLAHLAQCRDEGIAETEVVAHRRPGARLLLTSRKTWMRRFEGVGVYTAMTPVVDHTPRETALRASEQRYRDIVETSSDGICIVDRRNVIVFANRRFSAMVGVHDLVGVSAFQFVAPQDRPVTQFNVHDGLAGRTEARLRRADGSFIWTSVSTNVLRDHVGMVTGLVRMFTDITEKKQNEEMRDDLVRQLVEAQESERRRVARELHDQMGQHLVGLSLGLSRLAIMGETVPDLVHVVARLKDIADVMASDVHRLAVELRPAALDDLGLSVALCNYVEQMGRRSGIAVDVHCDSDTRLPPAVETAVYRIAQEALTNVSKHAHARHVSLILERFSGTLQLIIEDDGQGFDAERLMRHEGPRDRLGLGGMLERAALIGAALQVESKPGQGTTLYLRVPIARESGHHEETETVTR